MGTIDGPIALAQPALDFEALARLRDEVRVIREQASPAFANYRDAKTGGYFHLVTADAKKPNAAGDPSWASTATVVSFLIRSGQWPPAGTRDSASVAAQKLIDHFVRDPSQWESAGLPLDNPFTLGFALELVIELLNAGGSLDSAQRAICISKLRALVDAVSSRGGTNVVGRVSCRDEVPNSYLTDLAVRVLDAWRASKRVGAAADIPGAVRARVRAEAINSINEQMALLLAERPGAEPLRADVFELAYAVVLVASFGPKGMTPELRTLLREALSAFFGAQRPDGSWPRSRRLFTYPTYGDAYCFDFEFLARLLRAFSGKDNDSNEKTLLPYLSGFQLAITRLVREAKPLPRQAFGWSSGHHRAFVYPESWSTAACFDVAYQVDTLVTDAITVTIEGALGRPTYGPRPPRDEKPFDDLLDSRLTVGASSKPTLKTVLLNRFLQPIVAKLVEIEKGREIGAGTPMSVILYGPPGTSKTTYAERMSQFLGWPLLTVDPSHLLGSGVDNIHLEINRLFRMLEKAERVVVFFDEIDELVRDRSDDSVEALSRFLTTSMLPRIVSLRRSRRLVFIVATNHVEAFDPAIARPGRFDLVLPVLPPSTEAKLGRWKPLATRLRRLGLIDAVEVREQIELLTFDETAAVVAQTKRTRTAAEFRASLHEAADAGVLRQPVTHGDTKTWADLMAQEESRMRDGGALPF